VYASLKNATAVTVNGHVIGRWVPSDSVTAQVFSYRTAATVERAAHAFRPVPKPSKRK
jgi:hypothetical protein